MNTSKRLAPWLVGIGLTAVSALAGPNAAAESLAPMSAPMATGDGSFSGCWTMRQTNGYVVQLTLGQPNESGHFIGTGLYDAVTGTISGQLSGRDVTFDAHWSNGSVGRYTGHRNDDGTWSGSSVYLADPTITADWTASQHP